MSALISFCESSIDSNSYQSDAEFSSLIKIKKLTAVAKLRTIIKFPDKAILNTIS